MMQNTRDWRATKWFFLLGLFSVFLPACGTEKADKEGCGTVIDLAGKPLADVRVFKSGDGPERIETVTDAQGRFQLTRFDHGPAYVFAEKPGFRFAGVRATTGSADITIKLIGQSEPPPNRPAASEPAPLQEQQKLAKRLLEKLWTEEARSKRFHQLPFTMSWIDPQLALRWSAESKNDQSDVIRVKMAGKIAEEDLEEALSLVGPVGGYRLGLLMALAHHHVVSDPEKAMRCVEEALVAARALDQPLRTGYLAALGSLLIRLGNKDVGWKMLDEAGQAAATFGADRDGARARGMVAEAMARSDLKRAMSLLEPIVSPNNPDRLRARVALAICEDNLDEALKFAPTPIEGGRLKLRIAYRLASTRPADALRVVETIQSGPQIDGGNVRKAMALGWVAVKIAPRDKPLACRLIDRAFAILMSPDISDSSIHLGWQSRAAFLAVQAKWIGYPDMESIVYRVLACPPSKEKRLAIQRIESQALIAAFLGLVDPRTAKEMLESIELQHKTIDAGPGKVRATSWIKAWLLADPERGEKLFVEALKSIAGKPGADTEVYHLIDATGVLAAPSREKARCVVFYPDFIDPDEEY